VVITMIRTQVSLTEEEYDAAQKEAERLGISLSELLRRSLRPQQAQDHVHQRPRPAR
jgi:hypothetical protein